MDDLWELPKACKQGWGALLRNENDTAFSLAQRILSLNSARLKSGRRDKGFAYEGHSIMGIVYVRDGELELAKNQLRLAGMNLVPTPSNTTFGPNFCLVQVLYERGVRDEIVDFLREYCLPVCVSKRNELEMWIEKIEASKEVNFRAEIEFVSWLFMDELTENAEFGDSDKR